MDTDRFYVFTTKGTNNVLVLDRDGQGKEDSQSLVLWATNREYADLIVHVLNRFNGQNIPSAEGPFDLTDAWEVVDLRTFIDGRHVQGNLGVGDKEQEDVLQRIVDGLNFLYRQREL
jgi:hypothetical protein